MSDARKVKDPARVPRTFYRQAGKLTVSMMVSVFIYGGVSWYLVQGGHPAHAVIGGGVYRLSQVGAFTLAFLVVMGSQYVSERMLKSPKARHPKQLYVITIIRCLASEFGLLLGLILLFLSRDLYGLIPFALFTLAALALSFPRQKSWEQWLGVRI